MTAGLGVTAQLETPALPPEHPLVPIVATALARRGHDRRHVRARTAVPWPASHFGLDRVALFRTASPEARYRVLAGCARDVLTEAYFVEKLGLGFAAKMVLLSETTDERVAYSLVAADEATHLAAIAAHLIERPDVGRAAPDDPFLRLLAEAIDTGSRTSLAFLIQVVLEGWGIVHYRALARGSTDEGVRRTLACIVKDEALHHGAGLAIIRRDGLPRTDRCATEDRLVPLLGMVRAGPQRLVARLGAVLGPLSRRQLARVFSELATEERTGEILTVLRKFLSRAPDIAARLGRLGLFRPFSPEECAAVVGGDAPRGGEELG